MNKDFSKNWISSKKPNKQRKYRFKAPLHIKGAFLNVHLSKELREKYHTRALRIRVGDKVKIMRGKFKKQEAKIEEVDVKGTKLYLSKVEHTKRDGTKARHHVQPSNVMIIELNTDDKRRFSAPSEAKTAKIAETKSTTETKNMAETKKAVQANKETPDVVHKNIQKEVKRPKKSAEAEQ